MVLRGEYEQSRKNGKHIMTEQWRSPRKIEEEIRIYRHERFESLMRQVDEGGMSLEVAINGLRAEIAGEVDLREASQVEQTEGAV